EQELLGDRPADLVGQGPGAVDAAVGGGQEAEARALAADAHVERRRQHRGTTVGEAVHHADGRLGAGADLVAAAVAHGGAGVELGLAVAAVVGALLVDVAAGREGALAGAGNDDAADAVVGLGLLDRVVQFGRELVAHGIELVRPVHRQDRDAAIV